jgi:uncharacterized protein involved in response to NO
MKNKSTILLKTLGIAIALLQLFDIAIHAATGQLEFLRVSSNGIILLWLAVSASEWRNAKGVLAAISAVGSYFILNLVFLAREGLTNPEQGGGVRVMLLLLVFLTMTSSSVLGYLQNRHV